MAINEKNSIFNFNIAFLGLSEDEIASKTGISIERVNELSSGAEPYVSELLSLAVAFDRSFMSLLVNEWHKHSFGEYYKADNGYLEKIIKEGDIKVLAFVFSSGVIVRCDDELRFVKYGKVIRQKAVDEALVKKAIELLLDNGLTGIATDISTSKIYYSVPGLDDIGFSRDLLKKYLFLLGRGSWYPYFVPFFNGLKDEGEKKILLDMAGDNLKAFYGEQCICAEGSSAPYVYYITEKDNFRQMSVLWSKCDFSLLHTENDLKHELAALQDEIFAAATPEK